MCRIVGQSIFLNEGGEHWCYMDGVSEYFFHLDFEFGFFCSLCSFILPIKDVDSGFADSRYWSFAFMVEPRRSMIKQ